MALELLEHLRRESAKVVETNQIKTNIIASTLVLNVWKSRAFITITSSHFLNTVPTSLMITYTWKLGIILMWNDALFQLCNEKIFPHQILTHTWTWSEAILSVAAESRSTSSLSSYKKSLNFSFNIVQLEHSVNNRWRFNFHLPGWVFLRAL